VILDRVRRVGAFRCAGSAEEQPAHPIRSVGDGRGWPSSYPIRKIESGINWERTRIELETLMTDDLGQTDTDRTSIPVTIHGAKHSASTFRANQNVK
jgi:hypothetical protein